MFINILDSFCHSLFTFLPFNCSYSRDFEVHPVPLRLFYENQQIFGEVQYFFKVFNLKIFSLCLAFLETFLPVNCENNS